MKTEIHLGDGLYAYYDGWHVILRAPRLEGDHYAFLDPYVLSAFIEFCIANQLVVKELNVPDKGTFDDESTD